MPKTPRIALRSELSIGDTWDLSKLYANDQSWSDGLSLYDKQITKIEAFRGSLAVSADRLADWLDFSSNLGQLEERLGYYCELRQTEDEGSGEARSMAGRFQMAATRAQAAAAWATPEIQAIPEDQIARFLESERLTDYRIYLEKIRRWKPHILSDKEERILALQTDSDTTPRDAFTVLTNVDLDFGLITTKDGPKPLSLSTWSTFMEEPDRQLRQRAYTAFYDVFERHKTTLAALYSGSVKQDVYKARVRGFSSSRAMALFPDAIPESVYENLLSTVSAHLDSLHRYYRLRQRALGLNELRHYDVYVPFISTPKTKTSWNEAVDLISDALQPLGAEYVDTLRAGLLGRWADRYENKGKRSGAFSAGSYVGEPYILMNYKDSLIRDVFTLAHEGGHSMHSWYSARSNPFMHYRYSIFEAEVASTFNEELLFRQLLAKAADRPLRLYLINKRIDDILATLFRQTMFAEYEDITHKLQEGGTPLTVEVLRAEYRRLLEKYFGPEMQFEAESDLEALRIPHFYGAFYVYKYATGLAASLALAEQVLAGGQAERKGYLNFLKSGGSRYPLDSLRQAGINMAEPAPVAAACQVFSRLVDELEQELA